LTLISFEIDGPAARITLNRAEKRNAIDERMIAELRGALEKAAAEADARVVVLAAQGPDFCAGMDLTMMADSADAGALEFLRAAERLAELYRSIRRHPQPVIAAVQGRALGGGCGLAMACDAVLAAESATFGFPEVKIGFVPAIVMSLLHRVTGEKRAFDLLTSAEAVDARQAHEIGMITRVFPDAEFRASVEAYAAGLAERSPSAVALTKKLLYSIDGMSFDAALDAGAATNALARMTGDARRGFERFGKRKL
jgi:methylglutaconyl-CoA hydratase